MLNLSFNKMTITCNTSVHYETSQTRLAYVCNCDTSDTETIISNFVIKSKAKDQISKTLLIGGMKDIRSTKASVNH